MQLLIVSKLDESHPLLSPADFTEVFQQIRRNLRISMVEGLSVLELSLVSIGSALFVNILGPTGLSA